MWPGACFVSWTGRSTGIAVAAPFRTKPSRRSGGRVTNGALFRRAAADCYRIGRPATASDAHDPLSPPIPPSGRSSASSSSALCLSSVVVFSRLASLAIGPAPIALATAAQRARRRIWGRASIDRAGDPAAAHASGDPDRLGVRPHGRGAAGPAAQSARRHGGVRRAPGGGLRGRARALFRPRRRAVLGPAGRGDRRRAPLDRPRGGGGGAQATIVVLVLAGLAVGSLAGAATSLAISLSPNPFAVTEIVFWLLGSLEDRSCIHVLLALPFILVARAPAPLRGAGPARPGARRGDGAKPRRQCRRGCERSSSPAAAIGTGASVAVAGSIGFVGLVSPHLVRPFVGYDPARTLVPAGLAGAALLLAADCAVRLIPSQARGEDRRADRPPRRAVLSLGHRPPQGRARGDARMTRLVCRKRACRSTSGAAALSGHRSRPRARPPHGGGRPERRRQDDAAAGARRACRAGRGRGRP